MSNFNEAKELSSILAGMVEGGSYEDKNEIYAPDYSPPDGDAYVVRAADLLLEQDAENETLRARITELEAQSGDAARPADDALWDETLRDRDAYHEFADDLAAQIAAITGVDIGEHSSANNPWQEAMLAADDFIAGQLKQLITPPTTPALTEAARMALGAVKLLQGAMLQCSPCQADECKQEQMEWFAVSDKRAIAAIAALTQALWGEV